MVTRTISLSLALGLLVGGLAGGGCFFVASTDIEGTGIGTVCESDDDCHASVCEDGLCTSACSADVECPTGSVCANGSCSLPMKAAWIYVGVPSDEGWTETHDQGREEAQKELAYLETVFVSDVSPVTYDEARFLEKVDELAGDGASVVISNSFVHRQLMKEAAARHPEVEFLTCSSNEVGDNLGSFFGRSYQAWYLAGFAAARMTETKQLGFLGSYVTPEVVRHINAFTLGARAADPQITVEVVWEGFWADIDHVLTGDPKIPDEDPLTRRLVASGCDVIAHNSDIGISVSVVEEIATSEDDPKRVFSIGNDNPDACQRRGETSCIGVPAWNWGPLYVDLLDRIHRRQWDPREVVNDPIRVGDDSVVEFIMNEDILELSLITDVEQELQAIADADTPAAPFVGPLCANREQRDPPCLDEGQVVSDQELATMCWFVEGVVMRAEPTSEPEPAEVPWGQQAVPTGVDDAAASYPDCRKNL